MLATSRRVLATWLVLPLSAATAPLAAQSYAVAPISNEEIFVAAFQRSASDWCTAGARDAVGAALQGAKSIAGRMLTAAEQARVTQALDSAHAKVLQRGGCRAIARTPQLVIVDGFHGHKWDTPRIEISPMRAADVEANAQMATQRIELGDSLLHRIPAFADYTFDAAGQLIAGRYRVPTGNAGFEARWMQLERLVLARHPALRALRHRVESRLAWRGEPTYTFASTSWSDSRFSAWRTSFRNPDTRVFEIEMYVTRGRQSELVIVVDYRGYFQR